MAYTQTTRLDLDKAVPGSNQVFETAVINDNWDKIDAEAVAIDARFDVVEADITTIQGDISDIQAVLPGIYTPVVTPVADTTYSLLATDAGDMLRFTSSSTVTFTIDNVLNPAEYVNCIQDGSGKVTFVAGAGVTLQSPSGATVRTSTQYAWASVICLASGVYRIVGNLEAVA